MLNMGKEELDEILSFTPEDKCTWLFSATVAAKSAAWWVSTWPIRSRSKSTRRHRQRTSSTATPSCVTPTKRNCTFLDLDPELYGVVFCRTRRDTQALAEELLKRGYRADALHGEMSQAQRDRVMLRFKQKHLQVLVATDVAARGIDVDNLTHVFHHSLPGEAAQYTHRSGRTARAGNKGISLVLMSVKERSHLNRIAKTLGIEFARAMVPNPEEIVNARMSTWGQGLIELPVGRGIPEDIWEQMSLLFEGHSKEELLRQIVLAEMRKLDTGGKADLNQSDMASRRRDRDDRDNRENWEARGSRPFRKKPFSKKRKPSGGAPKWDKPQDAFADKPGKPMGAGKAKKKAKKRPAFKPGQEPWNTAGSGGAPGFSVKKKGKKKRR